MNPSLVYSVYLLVVLNVAGILAAPTQNSTALAASEDLESEGWDVTQLLRKPQLDGRIVGGLPAPINKFPYQLSLRYNNRHSCGAAIVSAAFAITAAHCIDPSKLAYRLSVRAGSSSLYAGGSVHQVTKVLIHPNYDSFAQDFDIAILQVQQPFRMNKVVSAVKLPRSGVEPAVGTLGIVSGWGTTKEGSVKPTLQLQFVKVPVVEQTTCAANYIGYGRITERMLCAGYQEGQRDSCQGDSGGPLVVDNVLVGVVSWGAGCARPSLPGIYTHVANPTLRAWISQNTGGL